MTLPAVLPGAALRMMRTAAGRRALQVVLLVGGLFALGLLCGEQAHAADGVLSTTSTSSVTRSVTSTASPASAASTASVAPTASAASTTSAPSDDVVSSDSAQGVRSLAKSQVVRSVDVRVAQPVGRLVGTVVTGLAEAEAEAKLPSPPESSELPSPPDLSDLPGLSELPGPPGLPALPGQTLPAPVTSAPESGSPGTPSATSGQGTEGRSAAAVPLTYGPRFDVGAAMSGGAGVAHTSAHRAGQLGETGQAPVHHAPPPGDPGGALSDKSAVDNGTPRHGDAHAVTDNSRAPLRLVAGVAARAVADGTRDRYRDIPVFPG
ncbi:hypothetical protein [Streptomyces sp. V4I2]|uniref:hypothetical protein n=1 Tax=Streptomyces sp. V4I2 TaxID=3042280 RepID=UPI002787BE81|nr:hypothetical protein [Streptomyces sp. V4I2]MDQ1048016.1 hypothetical protein [Streptomyces sp. V4I2]